MLESLQDADGLVPLKHVHIDQHDHRELLLGKGGTRVYVDPHAFGVADIILSRTHLCEIARLRLSTSRTGMKRLPIFGVPFDRAVQNARAARPGFLLKSMYKLVENQDLESRGLCATLVAHARRTSENVQVEAWQLIPGNAETYYVHALLDTGATIFQHLDGATMLHSADDAEVLFNAGIKRKGGEYLKYFRLDGEVQTEEGLELVRAYLPNEKLNHEYFETICESEI